MGLWRLAVRAQAQVARWTVAFRSLMDTARLGMLSLPWVWQLRDAFRRLRLRADALGYRTQAGLSRAGESASVLGQLLRAAGLSGAAALGLLVAVEIVVRILRDWGLTGVLVDAIPSSAYESVLLAVASFGATILGLYFTALSVVISTTYARAPSSVRGLVAQDQAGTVFARSVAGLVVVSVSLATVGLLGMNAAGITLALVGAVTAFSIIVLLRLSLRTFSFFDPVSLSPPLLRDFKRWTRRAAVGGLRWRVPSFQDAYRRKAQGVLTTFRELIGFTAEVERADIVDLRRLGQRMLWMWARYSSDKTSVPVGSRWFERTYEHPDWFTESATSLHVALATDVGLTARVSEYGDSAWAERQMADAVGACIEELLEGGHRQAVVELLQAASQLAGELGRRVQVSEGKLLCEALALVWDEHDEQGEPGEDDAEAQVAPARADSLAVADALCLIPINLLLGLVDRCSSMDATAITDEVDAALARPEGPLSSDLPIDVVTQLDQLRSRLDFELKVEGRQVTPAWWLHHMAARHTLAVLHEALVDVATLIESEIVARAEALPFPDRAFEAAAVASRGLEASHKLTFHLEAIRVTFEQLESLRVVDDQFWPETNLPALNGRAEELHNRTVDVLAEVAPILGMYERDESLPDLFGQGHAVLVRETFNAIVAGDAERFGELWPQVFVSGLLGYDRTRRTLADHHDEETAAIYVSELLADLFELSGYALVTSALDGGPFWEICKERWDGLFGNADDPEERARAMMAFAQLRSSTLGVLPRATIRNNRQRRYRSLLSERGLVGDRLSNFDRDVNHPNPIVRAFTRGTAGINDAVDIFVVEYLSHLPGAGEIPQRARTLARSIERERSSEERIQ